MFPVAIGCDTDIRECGGATGASLVKGWASIPESYVTMVPVATMDRVLGNALQGKRVLILVDIEGAELMMLQGATQALTNDPRPIWMVEISASEHQPNEININPNLLSTFEIFWNKGYESWTANDQLRLVSHEEVEAIAGSGVDILRTHNFLFIESGRNGEMLDA